jgi:hypothetical protein
MSMAKFTINVLWITSLVLPLVVFLLVNARASLWAKLTIAAVAVGAGWCLTVAYTVAAGAITLSLSGLDEQRTILDHDGAPHAFAATLGWVPALIVVGAAWLTRALLVRGRSRNSPS